MSKSKKYVFCLVMENNNTIIKKAAPTASGCHKNHDRGTYQCRVSYAQLNLSISCIILIKTDKFKFEHTDATSSTLKGRETIQLLSALSSKDCISDGTGVRYCPVRAT